MPRPIRPLHRAATAQRPGARNRCPTSHRIITDEPAKYPSGIGQGEIGMPRSNALICALIVLFTAGSHAQEMIPHRQDRLPNRPYSPEEAIEAMTVPPGFSVELVAAEPDIVNPIAMAFDDRGRIWVTESLEYPRKEAGT